MKALKKIARKMRPKISPRMKDRLTFTSRLMVLSLIFFGVWWMMPTFELAKLLTAQVMAITTGSEMIAGMDGYYVVTPDGFNLMIITDCVGWKELFVFLALLLAWPKQKSWLRALISMAGILVYNLIRLDLLIFFRDSFTYFHPAFQWVSIGVILGFWLWSVGVIGNKIKQPKKRKAKKSGKKAKPKSEK
ncbi:MAG TPA: hypothetical protein ENN60_03955 [archaeon]|nr:hypothetical protein [archaeon]